MSELSLVGITRKTSGFGVACQSSHVRSARSQFTSVSGRKLSGTRPSPPTPLPGERGAGGELLTHFEATPANAKGGPRCRSPPLVNQCDLAVVFAGLPGSRERLRYYHAKCANALLASAILWTFSRLVIAAPSRLKAAMNSSDSETAMPRPLRPRQASRIQRIAKAR